MAVSNTYLACVPKILSSHYTGCFKLKLDDFLPCYPFTDLQFLPSTFSYVFRAVWKNRFLNKNMRQEMLTLSC